MPRPSRRPPPGTRLPTLRVVGEAAYDQAASYEEMATRLGGMVGTVQARLMQTRRRW